MKKMDRSRVNFSALGGLLLMVFSFVSFVSPAHGRCDLSGDWQVYAPAIPETFGIMNITSKGDGGYEYVGYHKTVTEFALGSGDLVVDDYIEAVMGIAVATRAFHFKWKINKQCTKGFGFFQAFGRNVYPTSITKIE